MATQVDKTRRRLLVSFNEELKDSIPSIDNATLTFVSFNEELKDFLRDVGVLLAELRIL